MSSGMYALNKALLTDGTQGSWSYYSNPLYTKPFKSYFLKAPRGRIFQLRLQMHLSKHCFMQFMRSAKSNEVVKSTV